MDQISLNYQISSGVVSIFTTVVLILLSIVLLYCIASLIAKIVASFKRELSFNDIMRLDETDFTDENQKEIKEEKLDEIVLHIKSIYARLY